MHHDGSRQAELKQGGPEQADRVARIGPFHVMDLLARAQALEVRGKDVIHLEVGEPDFPTPPAVVAAGQKALEAGQSRYTPAAGLPALREAIAAYYQQRFSITLPADRILLTPGASGALQLALALLVNPGDGVLVTDPGYPCNRHFLQLVNGIPQTLSLKASEGFAVSAQALVQAWKDNTVAAMLASPDNPTGNLVDRQTLDDIAGKIRQRNGSLIMDEIYQGLVYESVPATVLSSMPEALVVNSFSKFFGMTGWRLGWLVAPEQHVPALERMAQNFFLAPPTLAQHAALAAFEEETLQELEQRRRVLDSRRRYLLKRLEQMGVTVVGQSAGAFYLYLDVSPWTRDSFAFCQQLLAEEFLAVTPGMDFGANHHPETYIRLAYACDQSRLEQAMERLQRFLERQ